MPIPIPIRRTSPKKKQNGNGLRPAAHVYVGYLAGIPVSTRYIIPNKIGLGNHVANTGVMIDKRYRGQGLGRAMLAFGIAKAKELGFRAIQLNLVVSTNQASIKLCKEFGFDGFVGVLPEAFHYKQERYIDVYVMYKRL